MIIKCCIGSGYGDGGKGMWTDYLVRNSEKPIVVRNNGGAQVGHTVVSGDKRYIFSHLGSGTLRGAPTLFTRNTVVNPILFLKETNRSRKQMLEYSANGNHPFSGRVSVFNIETKKGEVISKDEFQKNREKYVGNRSKIRKEMLNALT